MPPYVFLSQCLSYAQSPPRPNLTSFLICQNEYAQLIAKRVSQEKTKKTELRKRRASSMRKE